MNPHKNIKDSAIVNKTNEAKIILITGGAGFIGSNLIHYLLNKYQECKIINFDKLTYAGNLLNLVQIEEDPRYVFVKGDVSNADDVRNIFEQFNPNFVINLAAESHVDRSIKNPNIFLSTNVLGTQILLNHSRENEVEKFIQISTDEVYGSISVGIASREIDKLNPANPYSASKAAADLVVGVAYQTYGQNVNIIRSCNNYGVFQFPEKLIPLMIVNIMQDKELPLYGDGKNIREWMHVKDHCRAIDLVLHNGKSGEIYNVGTGDNWENLKLVEYLLSKFPNSKSKIKYVLDRQGHDFRYALDFSKIQNNLSWKPEITFENGLDETIQWYTNHAEWIAEVLSGDYLKYYEKYYAHKMMELS